jgi:hypothetical protein
MCLEIYYWLYKRGSHPLNAKCPSCGNAIQGVKLERGPLGDGFSGPLVSGYAAVCPTCRAVLGAVPDLDAVADKVAARLRKAK